VNNHLFEVKVQGKLYSSDRKRIIFQGQTFSDLTELESEDLLVWCSAKYLDSARITIREYIEDVQTYERTTLSILTYCLIFNRGKRRLVLLNDVA